MPHILVQDNQSKELIDFGHKQSINMYVCGPTVYDSSHLGHARNYIVFDTMRRILEDYFGMNVFFVMNITDIDDKIIKKADAVYKDNSLKSCGLISKQFEDSFFADMDKLNIKRPTVTTRVTEYIQEMILYIKQIMKNGYAYQTEDGSIYFNSKKYMEDGNITNPFQLNQVALTDPDSDSGDFCLWKGKKPNEPYYSTDIGDGRPGWHIECSAMASKIFPEGIDIHGGGIDLIFPHHHNEILQANAHYIRKPNKPDCIDSTHGPHCTHDSYDGSWTTAFTHCGHLSIKGLKMSKTEKNFITIEKFLQTYSPQLIRIYFLMYQYEKELELSETEILNLGTIDSKFKIFLNLTNVISIYKNNDSYTEREKQLIKKLEETILLIDISLRNNFETRRVILGLEELIDCINKYIAETKDNSINKNIVLKLYGYVVKIIRILGLEYVTESTTQHKELIDTILQMRSKLRILLIEEKEMPKNAKKKLYEMTDNIRDIILPKLNISITDLT